MATRNLKKGMKGNDVLKVQKQLKELGYYSGALDGDFGSYTEAAVKRFQTANGLKATGIVDQKTSAALSGKTKGKAGTVVKKGEKPKNAKSKGGTRNIAKWNGHKFTVSSKLIRSFEDLQIKGSSELKSSQDSGQGKVTWKGGNPTEITLTVVLNAFVGSSVRKEAMALVKKSREGKTDYFYVGTKKLVPYKLMLTSASVKDIEISNGGKWTSAKVALTLKQCDKGGPSSPDSSSTPSSGGGSPSGGGGGNGGGGGGGGGGSSKVSVRTSQPVVTPSSNGKIHGAAQTWRQSNGVDGVSSAQPTATGTTTQAKVTGATGRINGLIGAARGQTPQAPTVSTTGKDTIA